MAKRFYYLLGLLLVGLIVHGVEPAEGQYWRVLSHTMARGVDVASGRPIGNTTKFLSIDEHAVCWFEMEIDGFGPLALTWKWFEPRGAIYREHSTVELVPRSGAYRFWDILKVTGTPAELKLGNWTVEVYVRTEKLFHTPFLIESPPTSYPVRVKISGLDRRFSTGLYVDGVKVGTILGEETKELTLMIGTVHTVSVDEYVQGGVGVRFYCAASSKSVTEESFQIFLYETEYYLKVSSEYGAPRGGGWHRAGSIANFSVSTPVTGQWAIQYLFRQWVGDFTGDSLLGMILMDGPKEVKAVWVADYSRVYSLIAIVVGTTALVVGTVLVARRRRLAEPVTARAAAPPALDCPTCGRQTLYVERVKRHYCTRCKKYL